MDQLLDDGMYSLYEESNNSLGETLLKSSEGYVNYLASAINDSGIAMKTINMTNISKLIAFMFVATSFLTVGYQIAQ